MKVRLQRNFFAPNGIIYRAVKGGTVDIPNELKDVLPSTARGVDGKLIKDGSTTVTKKAAKAQIEQVAETKAPVQEEPKFNRAEAMQEAKDLGLKPAGNISNVALKELLEAAKTAETEETAETETETEEEAAPSAADLLQK